MTEFETKLVEYSSLLKQHAPKEGVNTTSINNVFTFRASQPHQRKPEMYPPGIVITGQGSKHCYLEGKRFDYSAGNLLTLFLSMPITVEITEASSDEPHLAAAVEIDLSRLANMLMTIDSVEQISVKPATADKSGIFSAPLKESLLDVAIRLLKILEKPSEVAVLGDAIVDEIYFRILSDEQGGTLKYLLQHRGQIHQVSRAVEYIHRNIDKQVAIDELAGLVNMSSSGFHKKFKQVMHLSPLQYAKSIKLHKAQTLIQEGKKANEAGYLVGYNSPAQFSREYKRHFGFVPSETLAS